MALCSLAVGALPGSIRLIEFLLPLLRLVLWPEPEARFRWCVERVTP